MSGRGPGVGMHGCVVAAGYACGDGLSVQCKGQYIYRDGSSLCLSIKNFPVLAASISSKLPDVAGSLPIKLHDQR